MLEEILSAAGVALSILALLFMLVPNVVARIETLRRFLDPINGFFEAIVYGAGAFLDAFRFVRSMFSASSLFWGTILLIWHNIYTFRDQLVDSRLVEVDARPPAGQFYVKVWAFIRRLFSVKMQAEVCEPVIEELKEDLLIAQQAAQSRTRLRVRFAIRTITTLGACGVVAIFRGITAVVPAQVRRWWTLFR